MVDRAADTAVAVGIVAVVRAVAVDIEVGQAVVADTAVDRPEEVVDTAAVADIEEVAVVDQGLGRKRER